LAIDYRILALDWRGHGRSDSPGADFGHAELADDAAAVIAAAGVDRVLLLPTAHAGWVALELARRLPGRVTGILALSWMVLGASRPFLDALAGLQDRSRWEEVRDRTFALWTDDHRNADADRYVNEHMGRHGFEMWARAGREISRAFERTPMPLRAFADLRPPIMLMHLYALPADPAYLRAQLEFAAQNRWFEAERFEGSTHFPSIEAPELVATAARRLTTRTGFAPTLPI